MEKRRSAWIRRLRRL